MSEAGNQTDFFFKEHWKRIPQSWLKTLTDLDTVQLAEILTNKPLVTRNVAPLSLLCFKTCCQTFSLDRTYKEDIEGVIQQLSENGDYQHSGCPSSESRALLQPTDTSGQLHAYFRKHVKPKKQHEIMNLGRVIHTLSTSVGCENVVDLGSGLGHLARILAFGFGLHVTSIEAADTHAPKATKYDNEIDREMKKKMEQRGQHPTLPCHVTSMIYPHMTSDDFMAIIQSQKQQPETEVQDHQSKGDNTLQDHQSKGDNKLKDCQSTGGNTVKDHKSKGDNKAHDHQSKGANTVWYQQSKEDNTVQDHQSKGENTAQDKKSKGGDEGQSNQTNVDNIDHKLKGGNQLQDKSKGDTNVHDHQSKGDNTDYMSHCQSARADRPGTSITVIDKNMSNQSTVEATMNDNTAKYITCNCTGNFADEGFINTEEPMDVEVTYRNKRLSNEDLDIKQSAKYPKVEKRKCDNCSGYKTPHNETRLDTSMPSVCRTLDKNYDNRNQTCKTIPERLNITVSDRLHDNYKNYYNLSDTKDSILEDTKNSTLNTQRYEVEHTDINSKREVHKKSDVRNVIQSDDVMVNICRSSVPTHTSDHLCNDVSASKAPWKFILTGLHACGDLTPTFLRFYVNCDTAIGLASVGCCYMKISDKSTESHEAGYPMSKYVASLPKHPQSYVARELACHFADTYYKRLKAGSPHLKIHSYRAALEWLANQICPDFQRTAVQIPAKKTNKMNFESYARLGLQKLGISDDKLTPALLEEATDMTDRWKDVVVFYTLRLALAPVVETLVLIDRMIFLFEQGHKSVLVPIFHPDLSPRNFVLLSCKK